MEISEMKYIVTEIKYAFDGFLYRHDIVNNIISV